MKTTLIALFLATNAAIAQSPAPKSSEPEDLARLRESWQRAKQQVTAPLDRKYVESLQSLKLRLTKAGNLEHALAVDTELKRIPADNPATAANSRAVATKSLLPKLRGTRWVVDEGSGPTHITFKGNEVLWREEKLKSEWTLKVSEQDDGALLVEWGRVSRRLEVTPDLTGMTVARANDPGQRHRATIVPK